MGGDIGWCGKLPVEINGEAGKGESKEQGGEKGEPLYPFEFGSLREGTAGEKPINKKISKLP